VWALAAGGQDGVRKLLGLMRDEIELALALLGCPTPEGLGPAHVTAPVRSR
jgi:4-hydroxymandelate oxidase